MKNSETPGSPGMARFRTSSHLQERFGSSRTASSSLSRLSLAAPHQIRASDLRHERAIDAIGRQVARLESRARPLSAHGEQEERAEAAAGPRVRAWRAGRPPGLGPWAARPIAALAPFGAADAWRKELQMTIVEYVRGRFRGLLEQFNTETLVEVLKSGWLSARRTPAEGLARSERPPAKRALGSFSPNLTGQLEDPCQKFCVWRSGSIFVFASAV